MEEESTALVPMDETAIEAPTVHLVARNPAEMDAARGDLASWLNLKLASIEAEIKDLNASISEARANGWRVDALTRARNKAVGQEMYYFKMLKAVEAGYMIIPEFPIDVFAIRVIRGGTRAGENTSTSMYGYPRIDPERPDTAPAGEGSYKNPIQMVYQGERKETQNDKETTVRYTRAASFQDEIVFPLQAARPLVMDATAQAMALKVFDQIGICLPTRNAGVLRRGDPLIIGQILGKRESYSQRVSSFIIAWYLNLEDL